MECEPNHSIFSLEGASKVTLAFSAATVRRKSLKNLILIRRKYIHNMHISSLTIVMAFEELQRKFLKGKSNILKMYTLGCVPLIYLLLNPSAASHNKN